MARKKYYKASALQIQKQYKKYIEYYQSNIAKINKKSVVELEYKPLDIVSFQNKLLEQRRINRREGIKISATKLVAIDISGIVTSEQAGAYVEGGQFNIETQKLLEQLGLDKKYSNIANLKGVSLRIELSNMLTEINNKLKEFGFDASEREHIISKNVFGS